MSAACSGAKSSTAQPSPPTIPGGSQCRAGDVCEEGFSCVDTRGPIGLVCAPECLSGTGCAEGQRCEDNGQCYPGLSCVDGGDELGTRCATLGEVVELGERCGPTDVCVAEAKCIEIAGELSRCQRCAAVTGCRPGAACTGDTLGGCGDYLSCIEGTCSAPCDPAGAADGTQCYGAVCLASPSSPAGGFCSQPAGLGEQCDPDQDNCGPASWCGPADSGGFVCLPRSVIGQGHCDSGDRVGEVCDAARPCPGGLCAQGCPIGYRELNDGQCHPEDGCDLATSAGCGEGQICELQTIYDRDGTAVITYCRSAGDREIGQSCNPDTDSCEEGLLCIPRPGLGHTCEERCEPIHDAWDDGCSASGAPHCDAGRCCVPVSCLDPWIPPELGGVMVPESDACDLRTQTGCLPAERCLPFVGAGNRGTCVAAGGESSIGEACEPGECSAGEVCAWDATRRSHLCHATCSLEHPLASCSALAAHLCQPVHPWGPNNTAGICTRYCAEPDDELPERFHCNEPDGSAAACLRRRTNRVQTPTHGERFQTRNGYSARCAGTCGPEPTCGGWEYCDVSGFCEGSAGGGTKCEVDSDCDSGLCLSTTSSTLSFCAGLTCDPTSESQCPDGSSCVEISDGRGFCGSNQDGSEVRGVLQLGSCGRYGEGCGDEPGARCRELASPLTGAHSSFTGICVQECVPGSTSPVSNCRGRPDACVEWLRDRACYPDNGGCDPASGDGCDLTEVCLPILYRTGGAPPPLHGVVTVCTTPGLGSASLGEHCQWLAEDPGEECGPGLLCVDTTLPQDECVGYCRPNEGGDCPPHAKCVDISTHSWGGDGRLGLCIADDGCDPIGQDCGAGQSCVPVTNAILGTTAEFATRCVQTANMSTGGDCAGADECAEGDVCLSSTASFRGPGDHLIRGCRRLCNADENTCPAEQTCFDVTDQLPPGSRRLGVCIEQEDP